MKVSHLGLIDFHAAYAIQERLAAEVAAGASPETLLLLEHPPVYTIGSGGSEVNVLDPAISAIRTNRGGDVTYHGPGQLVGYPVVSLSRRGRDLHRYLRFLEKFLIHIAGEYGVTARQVPGKTGIWTDRGKLASIGVGVRRWTTMHGFALNLAPDLTAFGRINPCGMAGCPVTSLEQETGAVPDLDMVVHAVAQYFPVLLDELLPSDTVEAGGLYVCC